MAPISFDWRFVAERGQGGAELVRDIVVQHGQMLDRDMLQRVVGQPLVCLAGVFMDGRRNDGLLAVGQEVENRVAIQLERSRRDLGPSLVEGREAFAPAFPDGTGRQNSIERGDDVLTITVDVNRREPAAGLSKCNADADAGSSGPLLDLRVGWEPIAELSPVIHSAISIEAWALRSGPDGDRRIAAGYQAGRSNLVGGIVLRR